MDKKEAVNVLGLVYGMIQYAHYQEKEGSIKDMPDAAVQHILSCIQEVIRVLKGRERNDNDNR